MTSPTAAQNNSPLSEYAHEQTPNILLAGHQNLQTGIDTMQALLGERRPDAHSGASKFSPTTVSYVISVLSIERLLQKKPAMLEAVGSGIENAARQAEHFSLVHDNVIANLAPSVGSSSHVFPIRHGCPVHRYSVLSPLPLTFPEAQLKRLSQLGWLTGERGSAVKLAGHI